MEDEPVFAHSMRVRSPYTDPLHYLQAELLRRDRQSEGKGEVPESVERALKVTMAGISAGMGNTGSRVGCNMGWLPWAHLLDPRSKPWLWRHDWHGS